MTFHLLDGRFLMIKPATKNPAGVIDISVVLNWFEELRQRAPPGPLRPQPPSAITARRDR